MEPWNDCPRLATKRHGATQIRLISGELWTILRTRACSRARMATYLFMAVDRFIEAQRADGYSPNTIRARAVCVRSVARQAGVEPEDLRNVHVVAYFASRPLKPWSRRTYLNHLGAFGKWLGISLIEGIRKPPAPRSIPNPLPDAELNKLVKVTTGRDRAWVLLGAFCGLRAHETAKLEAGDLVDGEEGEVVIRVTGKGGRTDILPVPPVVLEALDRSVEGRFCARRPSGACFPLRGD
jgi:integrase